MQPKNKWRSCRLAVNNETGRVRWCIGQERTWRTKLKLLVFLPAILLSATLVSVLYTRFVDSTGSFSKEENIVTLKNFEETETIENEDREILKDTKTSYIPLDNILLNAARNQQFRSKHRREVEISAMPFEASNTFPKYELHPNNTEDIETFQNSETRVLLWQVPLREGKAEGIEKQPSLSELDEAETGPDIFHLSNDFREHQSFWKDTLGPEAVRRTQAKMMKRYMNKKVEPCADFYEHACGNWAKYNPIPADKAGYDTFEILRESLDTVLRDLLVEDTIMEVPPNDDNVLREDTGVKKRSYSSNQYEFQHNNTFALIPSFALMLKNNSAENAITKAKNLFRSCMNADLLKKRGETPLLNLLRYLGGWPILEPGWDESQFDFILLMSQLRLYNNDILISEWVGPDIKNSKEYVIQLDQTTLGLPSREYFLETANIKYIEAYRIYMITVASLLGAPIISATEGADNIINFETHLAQITAPPELRRNITEIYKRFSLGQLKAMIPQINWYRYFNIVLQENIDTEQPVVCFCVTYLQNLVALLATTPPRTIANYLLWRFVRHRVNNLDERFQEAKQRFYYVLFAREKSPPRWQTCVSQVNANMGMALGSLFVNKYFDETSKNDTLQMTIEIQQAFRELLINTDWLDNDTKKLAHLKIDAMRLRIGYPDFILNMEDLAARYKDVQIHPDFYFENTLSILQHLTRAEQSRLGTIVNKTIWNTAPAVINAYYSRNKNQIMFPAGILQPPFYHRYFPRALNYGGIGVVIGHEITHGFDDKGRLFDKEGNLHRWWKDKSIDEFHDRTQCLIDQYNSYTVSEVDIQVDGVSTQGENIADNGGIKHALRAYTHWLNKNKQEQDTLPGLNLTNKQLFFLNFAQVWCGTSRPEATKNKLKTAVHSPGRYRVIGTLSNLEEFSEVYKCPMGSPMNPVLKCRIW